MTYVKDLVRVQLSALSDGNSIIPDKFYCKVLRETDVTVGQQLIVFKAWWRPNKLPIECIYWFSQFIKQLYIPNISYYYLLHARHFARSQACTLWPTGPFQPFTCFRVKHGELNGLKRIKRRRFHDMRKLYENQTSVSMNKVFLEYSHAYCLGLHLHNNGRIG